MTPRGFAGLAAIATGLFCLAACQPGIDLSGTYTHHDYPWSGWPKIDIRTSFPAPVFTGTFTVYFLDYVEIPILGTISNEDEIAFMVYHRDPAILGLCVCRGFDDGSSIFPGSGEIAGDGLADRLACSTYLGQPQEPPAEVFRIDWPVPPAGLFPGEASARYK